MRSRREEAGDDCRRGCRTRRGRGACRCRGRCGCRRSRCARRGELRFLADRELREQLAARADADAPALADEPLVAADGVLVGVDVAVDRVDGGDRRQQRRLAVPPVTRLPGVTFLRLVRPAIGAWTSRPVDVELRRVDGGLRGGDGGLRASTRCRALKMSISDAAPVPSSGRSARTRPAPASSCASACAASPLHGRARPGTAAGR